jgi:DNA-binding NarL/FixJ family response regulator
MPKLSGIEATRQIKVTYPGIKILILSMHKDEEYVSHALSAGADGYLLKEDSDRELFVAIGMIRQGKIYVSPLLSEKGPEWLASITH